MKESLLTRQDTDEKSVSTKEVALYLMQQRGYESLKVIIERCKDGVIKYVVSSRDPNTEKDYFDEIKELCQSARITHFERGRESKEPFEGLGLAIGWRWLIQNVPNLVVIHDSVLPLYRGFNPVVTSLINGDTTLGATAFFASERYDEGNIVGQTSIEITYPITISTALDKLALIIKDLAADVISDYFAGNLINGREQDQKKATYSVWRDEEDYRIDWKRDAEYIRRFVDAVGTPYFGAQTIADDKSMRVLQGEVVSDVEVIDRERNIGKVIFLEAGLPVIVCGKGLFKITELVDEDGKLALPLKKFRIRFR